MHQVIIDNSIVIHDDSVATTNARVLNGQIDDAINSISKFTFTINSNNPGWSEIQEYASKIQVVKNDKNIFQGRVIQVVPTMSANGLIQKRVTCESALGMLNDSILNYNNLISSNPAWIIQQTLLWHNEQVSGDQKISAGTIDVADYSNYAYEYRWQCTYDFLKTEIVDRLGAEMQIRYDDDGTKRLDIMKKINDTEGCDIEICKNLKTITITPTVSDVATRIIPLGVELDGGQRVNISTENDGKIYIEDVALQKKYGGDIITKVEIRNYPEGAESGLKTWGEYHLKGLNATKTQYAVSALDLSSINKNYDEFVIGNTHKIINPLMDLNTKLRLVGKQYYIDKPYLSNLTFGDKSSYLSQTLARRLK